MNTEKREFEEKDSFFYNNYAYMDLVLQKCMKTLSKGELFSDEEQCAKNVSYIIKEADAIVKEELRRNFN